MKRQGTTKGDVVGSIVVLAFFTCVVVGVSAFMLTPIVQQAATAGWPSAPGSVTQSSIVVTKDSGGNEHARAVVWYDYHAGRQRFTCGTVALGTDLLGAGDEYARGVASEFPVGPVTVFYNPQHPDEAVIRPGMTPLHWVETLLGLLPASMGAIFIGGIFSLLRWLRPGHVCGREVLYPAPHVYVLHAAVVAPLTASLMAVPATIVVFNVLTATVYVSGGSRWAFLLLVSALCAAPLAAWCTYRARKRWIADGRRSLVIDGPEGMVLLPRSACSTVPALSVHDARVTVENQRSQAGTPTLVWGVWLMDIHAPKGRHLVGTTGKRAHAQQLAEWLEQRLAEARLVAPPPLPAAVPALS